MEEQKLTNEKPGMLSWPKAFSSALRQSPWYAWYKPLLAIVLTIVSYVIFYFVVEYGESLFRALVVAYASGEIATDAYLGTDLTDPVNIAFAVAKVAVFIPAVMIGMKALNLGGLGSLLSLEGRMRWERIVKLYPPIFAATCVALVLSALVELAIAGDFGLLGTPRFAPLALIASFVLVPVQAAAEEIFFRGMVLRAIGSWVPVVVVAVVLQAAFFAVFHGYDLMGKLCCFLDGLLWGWLAVKTGGIEAPLCLHAANNTALYMIGSVFVTTTTTSTVTVETFVSSVVISVTMATIGYFLCKRNGYVVPNER